MNPRHFFRRWAAALLLAGALTAEAALVAGGTAYTKNLETRLLAEPRPLAAVTGKVRYAVKLAVQEAKGPWLRVSDGTASGWVFAGNVAETRPGEIAGADGLGLSASTTSATAAARPFTEVGAAYATQHNLGNSREDLEWLIAEGARVTVQDVEAFLKEQKKGEYQ
jgi:hypothetical protein